MKHLPIHVVIILVIIYMAYGSFDRNPESSELVGQIVRTHDGDTVTLRTTKGTNLQIRLRGIDAPELAQPYGNLSKARLTQLIQGQTVRIVTYGQDQYQRYIGDIFLNNESINQQMVQDGMAWVYRKYYTGKEWLKLEAAAQKQRIGIWQREDNQKPWEFRKTQREAAG